MYTIQIKYRCKSNTSQIEIQKTGRSKQKGGHSTVTEVANTYTNTDTNTYTNTLPLKGEVKYASGDEDTMQ